MPYTQEWVDPEVMVEHKGVKVYRTYKENEFENPNTFWFTLDCDVDSYDDDPHEFDVRELQTDLKLPDPGYDDNKIREILQTAIDAGLLVKKARSG